MLDLSKPLDPIDGITLFADHSELDLYYYLPDRIGLNYSAADQPDLSLQIYYPDEALIGSGAEALDKSTGSILSLGVHCQLSNDELASLRSKLVSRIGNDQLRLVAPPWEDGTVQLMVLDTVSGQDPNRDSMVTGIVGSRKPSLQDGNLNAVFQAKLDRRGAALALAAIQGQTSSVAGVLYDLKFAALRPAVNLRMTADLNRVAETFSAGVGVSCYYVGADVSAAFTQMQEKGIINVELTSEVADPEAERLVNEAVKDFYDQLMHELFTPVVSPAQLASGGIGSAKPQSSIVSLRFSYNRTTQDRHIEVDYRKRSATIRTHNPQAHLYNLSGIAGGADRVVQRVKLSQAWREFQLEVATPGAFSDPTLREVRVVLWRGQDGVLPPEAAIDGGLRIPPSALPLADFAFHQANNSSRKLMWISQPDEAPFYRWQARFTFAPDDHIDSPSEIWTEPRISSSANLDLYPEILVPLKKINAQLGAGWNPPVKFAEVSVFARDDKAKQIAQCILRLDATSPKSAWAVRSGQQVPLTLEAATTLHFDDDAQLAMPVRALLDPQLILNSPFVRTVTVTPLVTGITDDLLEVILQVRYSDAATGYTQNMTARMQAPSFSATDMKIPVLHANDKVTWQAMCVLKTGETRVIAKGETVGGVVTIAPKGAVRRIRVEWLGAAPADQNLRWLRTTIRSRKDSGEIADSKQLTFKGSKIPDAQDVVLPADGIVEWSNERLFEDGNHDKTSFVTLNEDTLAVTG